MLQAWKVLTTSTTSALVSTCWMLTAHTDHHGGAAGRILTRQPQPGVDWNGKNYHIHTFGCQMNLADSERMAGVLDSAGYSCTEDPSEADVLIYNTCSIRDKAEQKVYSALGRQVGIQLQKGSIPDETLQQDLKWTPGVLTRCCGKFPRQIHSFVSHRPASESIFLLHSSKDLQALHRL